MIRHRRTIVFSLPHVLWMLTALLLVVTNWLSLWDFHNLTTMPQATIAAGFGFSVLSYFFCALVSPDFIVAPLILNFAAGSGMGIQNGPTRTPWPSQWSSLQQRRSGFAPLGFRRLRPLS